MEARFPGLYKSMRHAHTEDLIRIYSETLEYAHEKLGPSDLEPFFALAKCRIGFDQQQIEDIAKHRDQHDDVYFNLSEDGNCENGDKAQHHFKFARILSSLHFFATMKDQQGLFDSFFEVLFAFDDPDAMCEKVINDIEASRIK